MFQRIREQLTPFGRKRFDRSVAATAGLLFGFVVCALLLLVSGHGLFVLTPAALTLYAAVLPLSIIGGLHTFLEEPPRLPVLASLWYLAMFVPILFFGELLLGGTGVLNMAGLSVGLPQLFGFRFIAMAAVAGALFAMVNAQGAMSAMAEEGESPNADWERRHREAIRRIASMDVDLRQRRQAELEELRRFDALLAASTPRERTPADDEPEADEDTAFEFVHAQVAATSAA